MSDRFFFTLPDTPGGVDPEAFFRFIRANIDGMNKLYIVELGENTVQWRIEKLSIQSPSVGCLLNDAETDVTSRWVQTAKGLSDSSDLMPGLDYEFARSMEDLALAIQPFGAAFLGAEEESKVKVNGSLYANVLTVKGKLGQETDPDSIGPIQPMSHSTYMTGTLHNLKDKPHPIGQRKPEFQLLLDREKTFLPCEFDPSMYEKVKAEYQADHFGQAKRVMVFGVVKYKGLKPERLTVSDIVELPSDDELPRLRDMVGVDPTRGVDTSEFIRKSRNGE